eukprot:TRINITY_DN2013_c0_g2_i7.p1 TRINITY_DN2013_c0_g2~~TRINITY_DN2013_c0_g2_i7.p1  ORF type:complete len:657 (-),score=131.20 TRINITY_DN2013_c0_g2_i7:781-2751(-)
MSLPSKSASEQENIKQRTLFDDVSEHEDDHQQNENDDPHHSANSPHSSSSRLPSMNEEDFGLESSSLLPNANARNGPSRQPSNRKLETKTDAENHEAPVKGKTRMMPEWISEAEAQLFNDSDLEFARQATQKGDFMFGDDEVEFNFVADFSKLLSMVRFLLHTVRKQTKMIKELESVVDRHAGVLDKVAGINIQGVVTQTELLKILLLPDGRSLRDTVLAHDDDINRNAGIVSDHTKKIETLETQVEGKADKDTTVNILVFDNLNKEYNDSKQLLETLSAEVETVRVIASNPQARDELCRQKIEDIQETLNRLDDGISTKLEKREYVYMIDNMIKKQRDAESGAETSGSKPQHGKDTAEAPSDTVSVNPLVYGIVGNKGLDSNYNSAIKNLTDVFLRTCSFSPSGQGANFGLDGSAVARSGTGKPMERLQVAGSSEYNSIMKEIEKLTFLINLKTYKHEVEEIIAQSSISKPQLELRLSGFFKQLRKVFQTDLTSILHKYVGDIKINPGDIRSMVNMDSSRQALEHAYHHPLASTRHASHGYSSPEPGHTLTGPTPRAPIADVKNHHYGSQMGANTLGPLGHPKGRSGDLKNTSGVTSPGPFGNPSLASSPFLSNTPTTRGGQSRTLKPLVKTIQEQTETQYSPTPSPANRRVSPG